MLPSVSDQGIDRSLRALTDEAEDDPRKTRHIDVGPGVLRAVAPWLERHRSSSRDVLICDAHTHRAAGAALAEYLRAAGRDVHEQVLEPSDGESELVCDEALIETVTDRLAGDSKSNAIAVGAGTINDTVKMATFKLERPYVSVATAASMNGYTSAIAAVLSRGVKRTWGAQQAEAVFADIDVIAAAPAYLNQAGFGDLLSKPYSNADWLLSHLIRDVPYLERPAKLLDEAYESLLSKARSVGAAESDGIGTLTRTILLSGFTMAIAGTSSPASGGEHLVSHYWDMEQHCRHRPLLGLHGTQVGVATRLSAILFEKLLEIDPTQIDPAGLAAASGGLDQSISHLHPRLTSEVVAEVQEQFDAKRKTGEELRAELEHVKTQWPRIRETLAAVLKPSAKMAQALADAGAVDRPSGLGVDRQRAVHTLQVCRQIRSRYVALDLMADLGHLDAWAAEAVDTVEQ